MKFRICGICSSFNSAKNWVRKLQIRKSQKTLGPQIANPPIATLAEGPSAHITNLVSQQICGFAICGTYLRTIHFCETEFRR